MPKRASALAWKVGLGPSVNTKSRTTRTRDELLEWWGQHPWNWLTGRDTTTKEWVEPNGEWVEEPEGRRVIYTTDERDLGEPVKPFPDDKPYLYRYVCRLVSQEKEDEIIFVDKSRQMIITTATVLTADWDCRFHAGRRWILSKRTRDEAGDIFEEKVRPVHLRLPDWVQDALPQSPRPHYKIRYPHIGGRSFFIGAAENVAEGAARGGTASGIIVDEAARQRYFGSILGAALPMARKLIAVTTAEMGNPGAEAFEKILREGKSYGDE